MNKVTLIGRLARDPELNYSGSGSANTRFTIAVDRRFPNKDGQREADFIQCVSFGKTAENIAKFFAKGNRIAIVGNIQVSSYESQNGERRYSTNVIIDEFEFIESRNQSQMSQDFSSDNNQDGFRSQPKGNDDLMSLDVDEDEIPF